MEENRSGIIQGAIPALACIVLENSKSLSEDGASGTDMNTRPPKNKTEVLITGSDL